MGTPLDLTTLGEVVKTHTTLYRLPHRMDWRHRVQVLEPVYGNTAESVEVPTRYLRRGGIQKGHRYAHLHIFELAGGAVLSFFTPKEITVDDIAPDLLKMLKEGEPL